MTTEIIPPSPIVVELNRANFCTIRDFGNGQKAEEWTHRTVMDSATFIICLTKAYEQGWQDRANKWIPVSERLPTHNHSVIGFVTAGGCAEVEAPMIDVVAYVPEKNCWLQYVGVSTVEVEGKTIPVYKDMDSDTDCRITVTHWQPLPEHPKGTK